MNAERQKVEKNVGRPLPRFSRRPVSSMTMMMMYQGMYQGMDQGIDGCG